MDRSHGRRCLQRAIRLHNFPPPANHLDLGQPPNDRRHIHHYIHQLLGADHVERANYLCEPIGAAIDYRAEHLDHRCSRPG